jgi:BMFP domain-containing protein YqiC
MSTGKRIFEDAARMAGGAAGALAGIKQEVEQLVRQQLDRLLDQLDLVTRDEFNAVKEMAATARAENEELARRLDALENSAAKPRKAAAKKGAQRKTGPAKG